MKIKELEKDNRPREKARRIGIRQLSNAELLALIIASGTKNKSSLEIGEDIMRSFHSIVNMSGISASQFEDFEGISDVKAQKFEAIFELQRRCLTEGYNEIYDGPLTLFNRYSKLLPLHSKEEVHALVYDSNYRFLRELEITQNFSSKVGVNTKNLIRTMFELDGHYLVVMHNHQGESSDPSEQDVFTTMKIANRLKNVGLRLLDSMIITRNSYFSFKEEGFLH